MQTGQNETKGKISFFEELHVYQEARKLVNQVYGITSNPAFSKDFGLKDQIRRASVSVMSNIAEGFERGSNTEFIQFLYIAKGSCGEMRAQMQIACDQKYIDGEKHKETSDSCQKVSRMINAFIYYLKSSKYSGHKYQK
jgi:four helix bundle protein